MGDVSEIYKSIFKNNDDVEKVTKNIGTSEILDIISQISTGSSEYLVSMWKTKRKVCRTEYVMKAMGNTYPQKIRDISIVIDATVNNLDELLDENLSKQIKTAHIVELTKDIGYLMKSNNLTDEQKNAISLYFKGKILAVAGGEFFYIGLIENSLKNKDDILKYGKKYYDSRIIDMDIFIELPLLELKYKNEDYENMLKVSRAFRAVNLIRKDLKDVKHDIENDSKSIFTIINKNNMDHKFYAKKMSEIYINEIISTIFKDKKLDIIKNNFLKMSKEIYEEINSA